MYRWTVLEVFVEPTKDRVMNDIYKPIVSIYLFHVDLSGWTLKRIQNIQSQATGQCVL